MDKIKNFFKFEERGTTIRAEIIAGCTTFMAMAYILVVNAGMLSAIDGVSYGAIYIATAISAVAGTILIGLLANLPLAQASGMGLNAFFTYTVVFGLGFTYANALVFVLFDGILFVVLTATGLRKIIFEGIPDCVKKAIPVGIGLFIAFIGFQDSGLVVDNGGTLVGLQSFNLLGDASWGSIMPLCLTIIAVFVIAVLTKKKVKGAILWTMLGTTLAYYLLGFTVSGFYDGFSERFDYSFVQPFKDFGTQSIGQVFAQGFNFDSYLEKHNAAQLIVAFATTALAFCMVDMFDTLGTLYGACKAGGLTIVKEDGKEDIPNANKAMISDAVATCVGAVCGTSTVTTFVESSAGVAAGGRTGFSSVITAALFFVAMFFSPLAQLIPSCAYAPALIYVGYAMMSNVVDINWKDPVIAIPAFFAIVIMPFTYNISYGIAFGLIAYVIISICTGAFKKINISTWVITILFVAMLFLTH